jgi:hypothetical protein
MNLGRRGMMLKLRVKNMMMMIFGVQLRRKCKRQNILCVISPPFFYSSCSLFSIITAPLSPYLTIKMMTILSGMMTKMTKTYHLLHLPMIPGGSTKL